MTGLISQDFASVTLSRKLEGSAGVAGLHHLKKKGSFMQSSFLVGEEPLASLQVEGTFKNKLFPDLGLDGWPDLVRAQKQETARKNRQRLKKWRIEDKSTHYTSTISRVFGSSSNLLGFHAS